MTQLKLMAILAHPDDESMGTGGILVKYAAEGVKTYVVTATRGQEGWFGKPEENPGPEELGRMRESELRAASKVLGLEDSCLLDYTDGALAAADHAEAVRKIVRCIRQFRPDVVVTFDQNGLYGHPDHIAISQLATAAVAAAADPSYVDCAGHTAHSVSKLYYMVWTEEERAVYEDAFGELTMEIDGQRRSAVLWPEWSVTTRIDATAHWRQVWQAVQCHRSQLPQYESLVKLPEATHEFMWGRFKYYRVFSRVNGGPEPEDDLFAGLR